MAFTTNRSGYETTTLDEEETVTALLGHREAHDDAHVMRQAKRQMLEMAVAERRWSLVERKVLLAVTVVAFIATVVLGALELTSGATASATAGTALAAALALRSRPRLYEPSQAAKVGG